MRISLNHISLQNRLEGRSQERSDITWLPRMGVDIRIIRIHGIECGKRFVQDRVRRVHRFSCIDALTSIDIVQVDISVDVVCDRLKSWIFPDLTRQAKPRDMSPARFAVLFFNWLLQRRCSDAYCDTCSRCCDTFCNIC